MTAEVLPKKILINEASAALTGLDALRTSLDGQDLSLLKPDPLEQALDNLGFIKGNVSERVNEYFVKTKGRLNFGYRTLSLFGEVPVMFMAQEDQAELSYAFDPGRKPAVLTEDLVRRLWNANINRNAIKALGSLSKEQILQRFESHILSSIK
jgi:hypothetical protein